MAKFHIHITSTPLVVLLLLLLLGNVTSGATYYGKRIGSLITYDHGVQGEVFAASDTQLYITGFYYDGNAPDAFVYMGSSPSPSASGTIISVNGKSTVLGAFNNAVVKLDLPDGTTLSDYTWISVWCRRFGVNFGDLVIPADAAPAPVSLGTLGFTPNRVHNVWAEDVIVLNNRQIKLVNLDFDGNAPDGYYWAGTGGTPTADGFALQDGSRGNTLEKLPRIAFNDKTLTVTIPENKGDIFSIGHIGLWCVRFTQDFGHVDIPTSASELQVPVYGEIVIATEAPATDAPATKAPATEGDVTSGAVYYGKRIGSLITKAHGVQGEVFAASDTQLYITGFYYDGTAPDAFVYMGNSPSPSASGSIISVNGKSTVLGAFSNAVVKLDLPDGTTLSDYTWISVWCRRFEVNFGDLAIPADAAPAPKSLGTLGFTPNRVHNVWAEDVIVLNNRQIKLVNLDFDGNAPDGYYWAGSGDTPTADGFALEDGSRGNTLDKLPRGQPFNDKTLTVTIPENRGDIFSIGHIGLWCVAFRQDFGHVDIPTSASELQVPVYGEIVMATEAPATDAPQPSESCKVLIDDMYQVRWSLTDTAIQVSLSARIDPGTYMAFGQSGSDTETSMVGSDVTVTWLDKETGATANAVDYYLSAYQQCVINSGSGACTDEGSTPSGTNDVTVGDHSNSNGIITISYTKPLNTRDTNTDKVIPTDTAVYVSWAIGPINPSGLVAKHRQVPTSSVMINFGEMGMTCPDFTAGEAETLPAWEIPSIGEKGKTEFQVDMGQAGGQQGYEGITGAPGWGIAWYVDGYIIPVLRLRRNVTYTFTVHGGNEEDIQARYHPFYITDDPVGGYFQKTMEERQGITNYAGPVNGSLCEWRSAGLSNPDDYNTFVGYRDASLERVCDPPVESATLTWTPDENTPSRVYYQCYTHKYLGWKIDIVDDFTEVITDAPDMMTTITTVMATEAPATKAPATEAPQPSESCKVLIDDMYQVRWSLTDTAIQVSLSARIDPGTYMAFGRSGSDTETSMVGSDVTVTWLDKETGATANAVDYYLSAYQQCVVNSGSGACTDEGSNLSGANDVTVGDHTNNNGIITISYTKPLDTGDTNADKVIPTDTAVYVSWAIGPINPSGLVAKHRQVPSSSVKINFGETGLTCPDFTSGEAEKLPAWEIPSIGEDGKTEFQVDMGQAGGQQGYEGITGAPGWGIAWYVDGYIIPVLRLKRNVTYTFTVHGGNEEHIQARYHPFYITDDPVGGYFQKTMDEREGITNYAGPVNGSLCEWRSAGLSNPDDFNTFVGYRDASLERVCDPPVENATLTWTPDENTPSRVYYQCYTHKYLGWKIDIVDDFTEVVTDAPDMTTMTTGGGQTILADKMSIFTMLVIGVFVMFGAK